MTYQAGDLRAIETNYRGHRFRSRTEARWAVFFDAAGIAWQYEAEGYNLDGRYYLPDFFLPELKVFVEVKPTKEAAEQATPLLRALAKASGCRTLFAVGAPDVDNEKPFIECSDFIRGVWHTGIGQCPFCNRVAFEFLPGMSCRCVGTVRLLDHGPFCKPLRLRHALGEAQRARLEHGEDGRPQPYTPPSSPLQTSVYLAGAIFQERDPTELEPDIVDIWRADIFSCETEELELGTTTGRFVYGGPTISYDHGEAVEELAENCLDEAIDADALFAWIDRYDTIGTLAEIGAAYARNKPIFIVFADEPLSRHFYFARQLATVAVVASDVTAAWALFARWQSNGVAAQRKVAHP
jgi:nucleoside 2-deoxyribosyltransferase